MFLFIYAMLLPTLVAASSTTFAYDIACSSDDSDGLPISLNNGLEYQVNVTISCSNDDFFYSLEPNDVVVLPAFLNEWTNQGKIYPNDSCVLNEIDGRSQGYSIRAESADSVINGTQSCNYSVGDYPVVNHTTDCKENDSGIFSLELENLGNTSVLVSVECTNQWFDYYLAPNTGVTLPSVFLEWTNQNRTYPENTCIFQDWGPRYQDVVIYSMEADWDYVVSFPGCYVRSGADLPVVEHSVNCPEETTGLFPVILENKGDVWLYVDVTCWNDLYWFYLAPNSSASLPAVFVDLANQQKTYPNDTCVFYLNDEGHQEVEVYSEESDWDYSFKALTCNYSVGAETPQFTYTFDCPESDTDVSSVYVQNNGTVWLYIEMWCWNSDYAFYLPPDANVSLPVMFREWINPAEAYPNGTCVMTDSADRTQFIGVYGAESDLDHMYDYLVCNRSVGESTPQISHSVNCSEDKAGNLAINLENTGDVWLYVDVGCWNDWFNFYLEPKSTAQLPAQFQDWANGNKTYPEDVCVLKEYDWHYQQVIVYSEESDWDFSYTYIGCDYSIGNDFPAISYNAQCPGDDGDFEISFENTGDTWLWVELDCLNGWQNVSLAPYSAQSVTASFDQWTNPEQFYSGTCLLEAVASHYQELRIIPWESDWDNSTHYVVCDFSVGSAAPKVNHNVDCAVNDSGVFTLNLVNTGDVWLYTELRCWNGLMTVYLPPRSTHQILAAYNEWTNQELNYASDICLFEDWGKTQEIEIYNEEEDFDNSYTYATCAYSVGDDVLRDDHSTDCRTDSQDGFTVTLSNPGDVWLYVYLGCSNDAFHFFLEPRSSQTVPAALNTHQDLASDTCVFFEKDETAYAYTYTEEPDWDYTERQLWCRRGMNIRRTHWTKDAFKMLHSSSK